jgi:hypothetical protein
MQFLLVLIHSMHSIEHFTHYAYESSKYPDEHGQLKFATELSSLFREVSQV